jgi:hypothetical protein
VVPDDLHPPEGGGQGRLTVKMLMLVVDGEKKEQLEVLLSRAGVDGYTEIPGAFGMGRTGLKLGSGAFPKTSAVIFSIVPDGVIAELTATIRAYCADCGERLKMVAWEVEEVL